MGLWLLFGMCVLYAPARLHAQVYAEAPASTNNYLQDTPNRYTLGVLASVGFVAYYFYPYPSQVTFGEVVLQSMTAQVYWHANLNDVGNTPLSLLIALGGGPSLWFQGTFGLGGTAFLENTEFSTGTFFNLGYEDGIYDPSVSLGVGIYMHSVFIRENLSFLVEVGWNVTIGPFISLGLGFVIPEL